MSGRLAPAVADDIAARIDWTPTCREGEERRVIVQQVAEALNGQLAAALETVEVLSDPDTMDAIREAEDETGGDEMRWSPGIGETVAHLGALIEWCERDSPADPEFFRHDGYVLTVEDLRRCRAALGDAGDPPAPAAATWSALLREMARRVATQRGATRLAMMALGDASDVRDDLMRSWTSDEPAAAAVRRVWPAGARVLDGMADAWLEDHWPDDIPDVPAPVGGAGDPAPADPAVREAIASALLDGAPPEAFDDLTRRVLACVASGALTGDDGAAIVTALAARTATPPPAEPDGRIVALRAMCTEAETTAVAAAAVDGLHRLPAWLTTPEIRSVIDEETTDGSR